MIPDLIFGTVIDTFALVFRFMPAPGIPTWLGPGGTIVTSAAALGGEASVLGVWLPFGAIADVVTAILVAIPVAVAIRGVRIISSYFTGGGGQ